MDNLDNFKQFVKANPTFAKFIKDGSMTWQKFYELYDMYGEDGEVWKEFRTVSTTKNSLTLNDIINIAKNIDMNKFQDGVNSLSKAVGLFSDLFASKANTETPYTPRAVYRRFDD